LDRKLRQHRGGNRKRNGGLEALGGGIYFVALAGSSKISITGSAISDNKAVVVGTGGGPDFVGGGGLLTTTSGGTVDHVLISGSKLLDNVLHAQTETNVTAYGGGLATSTQSGLTVKSSRIDGSRFSILSAQDASASGGGIYEEGPASVTSSSISSGSIDEHAYTNAFASGGGIDEEGTGALAVTTSTVDENKVKELSDTALAPAGEAGSIPPVRSRSRDRRSAGTRSPRQPMAPMSAAAWAAASTSRVNPTPSPIRPSPGTPS
jgi:hypothetical protein